MWRVPRGGIFQQEARWMWLLGLLPILFALFVLLVPWVARSIRP